MQTIHPKVHRGGGRRDGGFMATTRRSGPSKLLGQSLRRERFPQRALVRRQEERVKEGAVPLGASAAADARTEQRAERIERFFWSVFGDRR